MVRDEALPLLKSDRSNHPISPSIAMSFTKILLFKGFKTDFWVLDKYPWFNILVLGSLLLGSVVLFTTRAALIEIASFLSCLFTFYILYQRYILQKLGTFRQLHNQMRQKINDFMLENNKLTRNIDQLEVSISG